MVPAIIAAAIAGISALKKRDDDKTARREQINAAEQKMWDERNERMREKNARFLGRDPEEGRFANELGAFRNQVNNAPDVSYDWAPLTKAVGTAAGAIYANGQRGGTDDDLFSGQKADVGETVDDALASYDANTGTRGGPVSDSTLLSDWQPVPYKPDDDDANSSFVRSYRR